MPTKETVPVNPWKDYTAAYRKRNPERVERWEANSSCKKLRRFIEKHPEEVDRIRKEVFGE